MLSSLKSDAKTYYLLSTKSEHDWWSKLLKRDYGHCFICVNDGYNWLVLNPIAPRLDVNILAVEAKKGIRDIFSHKSYRCLKVTLKDSQRLRFQFGFFSCVSVIKYFVGLRGCWRFTPWSLHKWLVNLPIKRYARHNLINVEIV